MYVLQVEGQECELLDAGRHAARKSVITEISIINLHPKSMQVNEFNMKYNNWGPVLRIVILPPPVAIPGKNGILDSGTGNAQEKEKRSFILLPPKKKEISTTEASPK